VDGGSPRIKEVCWRVVRVVQPVMIKKICEELDQVQGDVTCFGTFQYEVWISEPVTSDGK